jgi:adenylate cyclase
MLPDGHFPISSLLIVPIVVGLETVGIVGLGNGKYSPDDGEILSDVFSRSWFNLLQESFSKIELKFKEKLLLNSLPNFALKKLQQSQNNTFAIEVEQVSIIFSDFVSFSENTRGWHPDSLVYFLNLMFSKFDDLLKFYEIEKVKTMGDGYMAVAGISDKDDEKQNAEKCALWALAVMDYIKYINNNQNLFPSLPKSIFPIEIRIGIATGN